MPLSRPGRGVRWPNGCNLVTRFGPLAPSACLGPLHDGGLLEHSAGGRHCRRAVEPWLSHVDERRLCPVLRAADASACLAAWRWHLGGGWRANRWRHDRRLQGSPVLRRYEYPPERSRCERSALGTVRITSYFDGAHGFPRLLDDPGEYSTAFETAYPEAADRRKYIEDAVKKGAPSFGHRVLATFISEGLVRCLFTTNFDPLIERATGVTDDLLPPDRQAHLSRERY